MHWLVWIFQVGRPLLQSTTAAQSKRLSWRVETLDGTTSTECQILPELLIRNELLIRKKSGTTLVAPLLL